MTQGRKQAAEEGFTSLQFAVMAFFTMVAFAAVVNLVAMQYQRGAVRIAVDEGARHGAAAGHTAADCEELAARIINADGEGLLRGALGSGIVIQCQEVGGSMEATATGVSEWWMGGLPDLPFTITGRAVIETFAEVP